MQNSRKMEPLEFIMFLHGFFEISGVDHLTRKQIQVIKDHLNLFFDKQTPDREHVNHCDSGECGACLACIMKAEPRIKCSCTQEDFPSYLCPMHGSLRQVKVNNPYRTPNSFPPEPDWTWRPEQGPQDTPNPIIC